MEVFQIYFNVCICCYRQISLVLNKKSPKNKGKNLNEIRCNVVHHSMLKSQKVNEKKWEEKRQRKYESSLIKYFMRWKKFRKKIIKTRWYDFESEFSSWREVGIETMARSPQILSAVPRRRDGNTNKKAPTSCSRNNLREFRMECSRSFPLFLCQFVLRDKLHWVSGDKNKTNKLSKTSTCAYVCLSARFCVNVCACMYVCVRVSVCECVR